MSGRFDSEHERRTALQEFARAELHGQDKALAFTNIIKRAVELDAGSPFASQAVVGDLKAVMISDGLLISGGRGESRYYVRDDSDFWGSTGFAKEFRDTGFQVHHAAAAIVIGYEYRNLVQYLIRKSELAGDNPETYAAALYKVLFPIGGWLNEADTRHFSALKPNRHKRRATPMGNRRNARNSVGICEEAA
jgi:hypothetical protein